MSLRELSDTIIAPITGVHRAAVAVIRLSGPHCFPIAAQVFEPFPSLVEPMRATYGRFITNDDGLCLPFAHARSYTGDETVEFSIHGSPASVRGLLQACCERGARLATPGEFTLRAFLNGRMDLTQAEGIRDAIVSETDAQLRAAFALRDGTMTAKVRAVTVLLRKVMGMIEASVDFSDEVGELNKEEAVQLLQRASSDVTALIKSSQVSRLLRQGLRIAIVGQPNSGKSSLLNALVGADRAIVTDTPGTTRDTIEELVSFGGFPCVFVDTAGLRHSVDPVERLGIVRSSEAAQGADCIWYLFDSSVGWNEEDERLVALLNSPRVHLLASKVDIGLPTNRGVPVSSVTRQGFDELEHLVALHFTETSATDFVLANARHLPLLQASKDEIEATIGCIRSDQPPDLAVVLIQQTIQCLGQITGETANAEMIEDLFAGFCIGK